MAIDFFAKDVLYRTSLPKEVNKSSVLGGTIDDSGSVSGVELRLLPPFIKDNNTPAFLGFPGKASLYCLVIVVGDADNQLAGGIDLQGFPRIGDHEALPINKTIYYWQAPSKKAKSPTQLHAFCSVMKSKKGLREAGEIMAKVKSDPDYKSITSQLATMASKATPVTAALDLITSITKVVGTHLQGVEDKPLGTIINSYTVLHGDFDTLGINKHRYSTPKVDFEMELTVRDTKRDPNRNGSVLGGKPSAGEEEDEVQVLLPGF
ncbi:hypothetical protein LX64_00793 [Chitinophaga skermanii]|uniref:Uncharacterized protein n=1 Tax=Chitinophaga skermanii TaxID=331697 RepID=A0A327R4P5_9BACT|nr:hypothetical protein [Chitinophaga skermanii]RAJ11185.1 hypothetical protein LX64_00793 [Chitinophaga skermanii]